ncbi:MAG: hypothetical protein ACLRI7_11460 [Ruthenibacterium lactatiformans]
MRGERPLMDSKFDLLQHPNVRHTEDGGAPPYDYTVAHGLKTIFPAVRRIMNCWICAIFAVETYEEATNPSGAVH